VEEIPKLTFENKFPVYVIMLWDHPTFQQSTGVGIQATTRYIHVHGNLTIRYHV
jgi:hypothetical protein